MAVVVVVVVVAVVDYNDVVVVIFLLVYELSADGECSLCTDSLTRQRPAVQSSTRDNLIASRAVDGRAGTAACSEDQDGHAWLSVDLGSQHSVGYVTLVNGDTGKLGNNTPSITEKSFIWLN